MIEIDGVKEALWATNHRDAAHFACYYDEMIAYATAPSVTQHETDAFNATRTDFRKNDSIIRQMLNSSGLEVIYDDVMGQIDQCVKDRQLQVRNNQLL